MNEVPPYIPEHCPSRLRPKQFHVILHTLFPSLSAPAHISHPCHHHISTSQHSNHPHFYAPDFRTTSICHASPHQPHSEPSIHIPSGWFLRWRIHMNIYNYTLFSDRYVPTRYYAQWSHYDSVTWQNFSRSNVNEFSHFHKNIFGQNTSAIDFPH